MPYTEYLDLEQLNDISGFDVEFEKEIFELYEQQFKEKYDLLEEALQRQDKTKSVFYSHDIKGSSANIGAVKVQAIAAQIELATKDEKLSDAVKLLPELSSQFKLLIKAIKEYIDGKNEEQLLQQQEEELNEE